MKPRSVTQELLYFGFMMGWLIHLGIKVTSLGLRQESLAGLIALALLGSATLGVVGYLLSEGELFDLGGVIVISLLGAYRAGQHFQALDGVWQLALAGTALVVALCGGLWSYAEVQRRARNGEEEAAAGRESLGEDAG